MTRSDAFTSDNARVKDPNAARPVPRSEEARVKAVYGPAGSLRDQTYTGQPGEWQAGYTSRFGFHIRGRHSSDPAAAVDAAIREHAKSKSYPTPEFPDPDTCWAKRKAVASASPLMNQPVPTTENTEPTETRKDHPETFFADLKSQVTRRGIGVPADEPAGRLF